jgi:hypothetical protein
MLILLLVVLVSLPLAADAQVMASRSVWIAPASDGPTGFMARTSFFGELQRARHSTADDLAWTIRTGGLWELYRWNASTVLAGSATAEVVANPYSSLGFNPRGVVWEEQLALVHRRGSLLWHGGLFHRCRHEIDNSDPPEQREPQPGYVPAKRVVVLSGVQLGATTKELHGAGLRVRTGLRAEAYLAREDTRVPVTPVRPYWTEALAAASAVARIERSLGTGTALYVRFWGAVIPFDDATRHNERGELGLRLSGAGGGMELFAAGERTFDDHASLTPRASRFVGLGFRFVGRDLY